MPEASPILIGHLLEARPGRLLAKLLSEAEGFQASITVEGRTQVVGQVGSYVSIRQEHCRILGLIHQVEADRASGRSAAGSLIAITPLGEIEADHHFHRGIRHYPTPAPRCTAWAPARSAGSSPVTAPTASHPPTSVNSPSGFT